MMTEDAKFAPAVTNGAAEVESRQSFDPWGSQLSGPSLEMGYLGA